MLFVLVICFQFIMKQITSLTGHSGAKDNNVQDYSVLMNADKYFAELTGILLGDGSISVYSKINHYRLQITLNSNEIEYAKYVQKLFNILTGSELTIKIRKNENALDLLCFKRIVIRKFITSGFITSPKWDRAIIPNQFMNKRLGKYVLRGYFDTDGSLVVTNNNGVMYPRLEMKIMPSPMKNQFIELLGMYGFKFRVYDIGKGKMRIQMNGKKQLEKWNKEIGFSNIRNIKKLII